MESNREKRKREHKEKQKIVSLKREQSTRLRRLGAILNKDEDLRTDEESKFLEENKSFITIAKCRLVRQNELKQRTEEIEDELDVLNDKIDKLVDLIGKSEHICVYTGAGISTSSNIPDYRGPNGVWTQLNKNGSVLKTQDLALATPTYTHMSLKALVKANIIKHIVSQNCDGLHLRSGLPIEKLSEIHGNMFVEVCPNCERAFYRNFDVTEHTGLRHHKTGRFCSHCIELDDKDINCELIDTIVHFGEKGYLNYPLNWAGASEAVSKCDLIICLGSSLKVLKNYSCLWPKKNHKKKKVTLVVCNLQWTPKDSQASLKINAKCDLLFEKLMRKLNLDVEPYDKDKDKLKQLYLPLKVDEQETCKRYQLFTTNQIKIESDSLTPGWFAKGANVKFKRTK